MKSLLLSTALFASLAVPAAAATLTIDVFDGSTLIGTATSTNGVANFNTTTEPNFDSIAVSAGGLPAVTGGDLSTTTLVVSSASSGVHVLTVDVFQTGISVPHGTSHSTFTTNNLIGAPGPTSMATFINGTDSTTGHPIANAAFAAGVTNATVGPVARTIPDVFADAAQYRIVFSGPDQSANDTIELTTTPGVIPESSTWAMVALGFGFLWAVTRRVNRPRLALT